MAKVLRDPPGTTFAFLGESVFCSRVASVVSLDGVKSRAWWETKYILE